MRKVIIIGCPGSGKSTFARKLNSITGLPVFYLDMIYHKPDRTTVSREEFDAKLSEIMKKEKWIIDGNYMRTMPIRIENADTIFWLDYPLEVCLQGIVERFGKPREDMPWVEREYDPEFMRFIREFDTTSKPKISTLLNVAQNKQIYIFKSRQEAQDFIDNYTRGAL